MRSLRSILLFLPVAALAGLYVPTTALLVNEAKPLDIDLRRNGLVAHVCDSGFNVGLSVDLMRISDQERFRMVLDPKLDRPLPPGHAPRLASDVVLQQLPPGSYLVRKVGLGDRDPVAIDPDTLVVKAGQILSLGRVRIAADLDFLGMLEQVRISTWNDTLEPRLKAIKAQGIDTLPVTLKRLKWTVRKN
jgi:hypothetical protein